MKLYSYSNENLTLSREHLGEYGDEASEAHGNTQIHEHGAQGSGSGHRLALVGSSLACSILERAVTTVRIMDAEE